jgi:hypothetical protein
MERHAPARGEMLERSIGGLFGLDTRNESEKLQQMLSQAKTPEQKAQLPEQLRQMGYGLQAAQLEEQLAAQKAAQEESAFRRSATERGLNVQEAAELRQQTQAEAAQRLAQANAERATQEREDAKAANMAVLNAATGITAEQRASLEAVAARSPITPAQLADLVVERYGGTLGKVEDDKITNYNALIDGRQGIVSERANGELFVTEQNESGVFVERRVDPQTVVLQGSASVGSSSGANQETINARVNLVQGANIPRQGDVDLLTALVKADSTMTMPELNSMIKNFGGTGAASATTGGFGTGVAAATLNAFVDLPGPIMDGTASQKDEDTFITAVTDYLQPTTSVDNFGNRVTTQKQLAPHVQAAYNEVMRRRAAPSNAAAAAATVEPEEALMPIRDRAQVFMEGGDVPAVPGQMAINILSGNVTGPINSLARTLALVPGQPFGTFNEPVNAKGFHDLLSLRALRVFQESPRFAEGERQKIEDLIDTANRFWDDPQRLIGAMIGIDQALSEVERGYEQVLRGEASLHTGETNSYGQQVPRETYETAAAALTAIKAYREFALPPRFTNNPADANRAAEFARNNPPGTMVLIQNSRGQWQIQEVQ